ncbi:hypothetical protein UFOVP1522_37 [uncultured Caudovirales phage]|uniref:Uncharacterized protein n=1 Tax=uncultured Caudovirales phage TaxID=2100421 RepID=A0A6J5SAT9_9CAUD|nr:hypothetical protein UFOVP989_50 [uncultured Caudovirales phage]CAB4181112.1 hypothetical protein UFOVP1075_16 [uncultured Caudovirales phage]CAB4198717.1 hypothetical protein UFOVP1312_8 [uncultured Caudovirales phage]CAB4210882.1 hypothetical protein UFOVP1426_50 [uncultured Caudovirales phage]CAB5227419.1 hypothetical protein UFOVP1522_37 [uncultured Caudovirales phage]
MSVDQLSLEAYLTRVMPAMTKREDEVLQALRELGSGNAYQVQQKLGYHNINMVAPRLTGLFKKGIIEVDRIENNEYGNRSHVYKVNKYWN